jgi:hypothetical protein
MAHKGARRKLGRFKPEDMSERDNNRREQRMKAEKAISIVKIEP